MPLRRACRRWALLVEPTPVLSILYELRTIEVGDEEVVMRFDNTGDHVVAPSTWTQRIPLCATLAPRPLHRPVGERALVIETIAFEPNLSGIALNVPRGRASTRSSD